MTVLLRYVRDRTRSLLGWSAGAVFLVVTTVAFYPFIREQPSVEDLAQDLPEGVKATFGISDAVSLASPEGYLQGRMFSLAMPLALVIFGIAVGSRAIGGSEDDGELELLLAQPVTRVRLFLGRFGAVLLLTVSLGTVFTAALFVLAPLFRATDGIRALWVGAACAGAVALAVLHASIAFAAGAVRGTRAAAVASATVVAVAGYLLHGLLAAAGTSESLRMVSPWHWYLRENMLADGPDLAALVLPLCVALLAVGGGAIVFSRRDLR